eukprot:6302-Heterococcus_DN1.PRE.5
MSHLQRLRDENAALLKRLTQTESDRSTLLTAMSNADALHREQLSSLRDALAREQQQAQQAEQQWSAEQTELMAALEAAQIHIRAYQAKELEAASDPEFMAGVQAFRQGMSNLHESCVDRNAEAARLTDRVAELRREADELQSAAQRNYVASFEEYIYTSSYICNYVQAVEEELMRQKQSTKPLRRSQVLSTMHTTNSMWHCYCCYRALHSDRHIIAKSANRG